VRFRMLVVRVLVGLLVGVLFAIVAVSLYYIVQFKTKWSSVRITVIASVVGLALSLGLSGFALWKVFPADSAVAPKTIPEYLKIIAEYLAGVILGGLIPGSAVGRILASIRDKNRYIKDANRASEQRWFDVPPPAP